MRKLAVIFACLFGLWFCGKLLVESPPTKSAQGDPVQAGRARARYADALANPSISKYTWQKEGFGNVMTVSMTIRNNGDRPVKDLEITCTHSAASGTVIDRNVRRLYQIIPPHSKRSFQDFNMGFIHSQAARSRCEVTDLVVMATGS